MKDSRIAADLVGYLKAIMPSTPSEVVDDGGRWGVRVLAIDEHVITMHLGRTEWSFTPGVRRIALAETYPQVPIFIAYMVGGATSIVAHSHALVPLDRVTEEAFRARREGQRSRLDEAVTYLRQVLADRRTNQNGLASAHQALGLIHDRIAELDDRVRNPGPGVPSPAGPDAILPGEAGVPPAPAGAS